ncbi:VOC family protein [Nocardia sp. NPDC051570]|uniref:VOC family protein n=1 Tax=Nocardia sp. NPDC051570 TaxID=3364324 RepID=UPI0037A1E10D
MIRWNRAFIDRPAAVFDEAFAFWTAVSASTLSERGGANGEFATLEPEDDDACLRAQAVGGPGGAHPDLDVDEPVAARQLARKLGARRMHRGAHWTVMNDPTGGVHCLTSRHPSNGKVPQQ